MNTLSTSRPPRSNLWALKSKASDASRSRVHASSTIATSLPESSSCTYWVKRFANEDLELRLPCVDSANRIPGTAICTPVAEVTAEAAERLRALARSELTTPFTLLLAAWEIVLFRHSGQSEFVLGCGTPGGTTVVQHSPLLVHATVSDQASFRTLLRTVAMRRAEGATHGNVTVPDLVRAFGDKTSPGRHPLFQAAFVQRNSLGENATHTADNKHTHPVDLACVWEDNGRSIRIRVEYPAGVIAPDVAARLPAHMANVLRAALSLPDAPIGTLPMLTAAEYLEKARG
jgi:non-ribosomal peptide synthetase component F